MSYVHALSSLVRLVTERSGFLELCVICEKLMVYRLEWLAMISERGVVYRTKRMGPSTEP